MNKQQKKKLLAGGLAMILTGVAGVSVPPELLLAVWSAFPWS